MFTLHDRKEDAPSGRWRRQRGSAAGLAFALVIVGVAAGTVLMAKQFLFQARISGLVTQIEKYRTATTSFRTMQNAWPGDFPSAQQRIRGCGGMTVEGQFCVNGDGDEVVGEIYGEMHNLDQSGIEYPYFETTGFWRHLHVSRILGGEIDPASDPAQPEWGRTHPFSKAGRGGYTVAYINQVPPGYQGGGHYLRLHREVRGDAILDMASNPLPLDMADAVDKKMDNGYRASGNVIFMGLGCGGQAGIEPAAGTFEDNPSETYTAPPAGTGAAPLENGDVYCVGYFKL